VLGGAETSEDVACVIGVGISVMAGQSSRANLGGVTPEVFLLLWEVQVNGNEGILLAGFISQSTSLCCVLTATENIPDQTLLTVQCLSICHCLSCWRLQHSFDNWPASANPMTVATVYELVSATCKAAFGGILAGAQPGYQERNVDMSS
jgi:hypothetical protein